MPQKRMRVQALVIDHRTQLRERDLIITLLCSDGTKRSAVVRNGARPGSKLAGACELLSESTFLLAEGRALDTICEAQLEASFSMLAGDIEYFAAACAVCELARKVSYKDLENPFLYALTRAILARMKGLLSAEQAHTCAQVPAQVPAHQSSSVPAGACALARPRTDVLASLVSAYAIKLSAHEGFLLETTHCVLCQEAFSLTALSQAAHSQAVRTKTPALTTLATSTPLAYAPSMASVLASSPALFFSREQGGVLCQSCASSEAMLEPIALTHCALVRELLMSPYRDIVDKTFDHESLRAVLHFAHVWSAYVFDTRLFAFDFFENSI